MNDNRSYQVSVSGFNPLQPDKNLLSPKNRKVRANPFASNRSEAMYWLEILDRQSEAQKSSAQNDGDLVVSINEFMVSG